MSPPIPSPALLGHVGLWRLWVAVGLLGLVVVALVVAGATIAHKAGYSPWWALLLLVPFVNLAVVIVFAGSRWPVLRAAEGRDAGNGPAPGRPPAARNPTDAGPGSPGPPDLPELDHPRPPGPPTTSPARSPIAPESAWRRPPEGEVRWPGLGSRRDRANSGGASSGMPGRGGADGAGPEGGRPGSATRASDPSEPR